MNISTIDESVPLLVLVGYEWLVPDDGEEELFEQFEFSFEKGDARRRSLSAMSRMEKRWVAKAERVVKSKRNK